MNSNGCYWIFSIQVFKININTLVTQQLRVHKRFIIQAGHQILIICILSVHSETGLCLARRFGEERQKPGLHKTYSLFSGQEIVEGIDIRTKLQRLATTCHQMQVWEWNLGIKFQDQPPDSQCMAVEILWITGRQS